jgi:lipopolysaccharide transport system permease protein
MPPTSEKGLQLTKGNARAIQILQGLASLLRTLVTKRTVLWALVKKDLKDKYASSFLGMLWTAFRPLATVLIYMFFFSLIYRSKVPAEYGNAPFIVFLLLGFTPFQVFSEVIGRSPSMLHSNISLITKMVFPYELLSVSACLSSLIGATVNLVMIVFLMVIYGTATHGLNLLYIPVFLFPLVFLTIGLSWILSCVGVIIRDTEQVVNIFLTLLLFLTPVFFSRGMVESVGESYPILAYILFLNPLYTIVEGLRTAFIGTGLGVNAALIIYMYCFSFGAFFLGGLVFLTFKREIADYL